MLCRVNLPYLDHLVIMEADYRRYIQGFNVIPADSRRKNKNKQTNMKWKGFQESPM